MPRFLTLFNPFLASFHSASPPISIPQFTHSLWRRAIKLEINKIDRDYPTELKILSEDRFSFIIRHYDLPTLMAGKMLACLDRVWKRGKTGITIKGRDYFDLVW